MNNLQVRKSIAKKVFITSIIVFIAIVPLIVRLKVVPIDHDIFLFWNGFKQNNDFFSYYKSRTIIIALLLSLIALGIAFIKSKPILKRNLLYLPMALYIFTILLSSIASNYQKVAWYGGPERHEGAIILIAYLVVCFVIINLAEQESQVKWIISALLISSTIVCLIGLGQYYGFKVLSSSIGKLLIIPASLRHANHFNETTLHVVASTLYNPNNAGMYLAMIFPLSMTLYFHIKRTKYRVLLGVVCCLIFAALLGTSARGAWLGAITALVLLALLLRKTGLENRQPALIMTLCLLIVYVIINFSGKDMVSQGFGSIAEGGRNTSLEQVLWKPEPSTPGVIHGVYQGVELWLRMGELTLQTPGKPWLRVGLNQGRISFYNQENRKLGLASGDKATWYVKDNKYSDFSIGLKKKDMTIRVGEVVLPRLTIVDGKYFCFSSALTAPIIDIDAQNKSLAFMHRGGEILQIQMKEGKPICQDTKGNYISLLKLDNRHCFLIADSRWADYLLAVKDNVLLVNKGGNRIRFASTQNGFCYLDVFGRQLSLKPAPSIGFKGRETMFSSRGYIWSRTLPLLKDVIWLGHGPDTYFIYFPQYDHVAKYLYLYNAEIVVDKPHNLYLQAWMNTGLISLLALLFLFGYYVLSSLKLYIHSFKNNTYSVVGMACLVAVVSYLVSGTMYDSCVSVAPVFWGLLGLGVACNRLYEESLVESEPVIDAPENSELGTEINVDI